MATATYNAVTAIDRAENRFRDINQGLLISDVRHQWDEMMSADERAAYDDFEDFCAALAYRLGRAA